MAVATAIERERSKAGSILGQAGGEARWRGSTKKERGEYCRMIATVKWEKLKKSEREESDE